MAGGLEVGSAGMSSRTWPSRDKVNAIEVLRAQLAEATTVKDMREARGTVLKIVAADHMESTDTLVGASPQPMN